MSQIEDEVPCVWHKDASCPIRTEMRAKQNLEQYIQKEKFSDKDMIKELAQTIFNEWIALAPFCMMCDKRIRMLPPTPPYEVISPPILEPQPIKRIPLTRCKEIKSFLLEKGITDEKIEIYETMASMIGEYIEKYGLPPPPKDEEN